MDCSYTVKDCILVDIPTCIDERGRISVMDKELPFEVKRVFWLHHIKEGKERGAHALLNGIEIMVAIHGSLVLDLDDSKDKVSIVLDCPEKGIIIKPGIWFRTHNFQDDGVALILADEEYSRDRYTYDYNIFLSLRRSNNNK